MLSFTVREAGDTGLVLDFGDRVDPHINHYVQELANRLDALVIVGVHETVPSFRSLLILYDPCILIADDLLKTVARILNSEDAAPTFKRLWRLPICYDAAVAEDITFLAEQLGLSQSSVVEAHCSQTYSIYMLGFLPGQPYLGDLAPELRIPRRASPRQKVEAGTVAIATSLTSIFPMATPCGWHVIGRTPVPLWLQPLDRGALLAPGDQIQFEPVCLDSFAALAAAASCGSLYLKPEILARSA